MPPPTPTGKATASPRPTRYRVPNMAGPMPPAVPKGKPDGPVRRNSQEMTFMPCMTRKPSMPKGNASASRPVSQTSKGANRSPSRDADSDRLDERRGVSGMTRQHAAVQRLYGEVDAYRDDHEGQPSRHPGV